MEGGEGVLPEAFAHQATLDLLKLGLAGIAIIALSYVVIVLWRDNKDLRKQIEKDQEAREKRDDGRFDEVKMLAETAAKALEKSSAASVALASALENTNGLVDKQGNLLESRTAIFSTIATNAAVNEQALRSLKESVDGLMRRLER